MRVYIVFEKNIDRRGLLTRAVQCLKNLGAEAPSIMIVTGPASWEPSALTNVEDLLNKHFNIEDALIQ